MPGTNMHWPEDLCRGTPIWPNAFGPALVGATNAGPPVFGPKVFAFGPAVGLGPIVCEVGPTVGPPISAAGPLGLGGTTIGPENDFGSAGVACVGLQLAQRFTWPKSGAVEQGRGSTGAAAADEIGPDASATWPKESWPNFGLAMALAFGIASIVGPADGIWPASC